MLQYFLLKKVKQISSMAQTDGRPIYIHSEYLIEVRLLLSMHNQSVTFSEIFKERLNLECTPHSLWIFIKMKNRNLCPQSFGWKLILIKMLYSQSSKIGPQSFQRIALDFDEFKAYCVTSIRFFFSFYNCS